MPRSTRDSDDDFEPATSRMQTRLLAEQSASSSLRRSSRIKQNKSSPGSESDNSSINSQTTRTTRTRTGTMDSTASDTVKKLRSNKLISSDCEIDIDTPQTPRKRTTRQSLGSSIATPTRVNTRAASKRFVRAASETQSPLLVARTTRKTRASSIGPESSFNQNKSQSDSPFKTRRRVSMLPSTSLVKEQIELENRVPYVRLDVTIIETDEIVSSGNSDSSPNKALLQSQKIKECQNTDKDSTDKDRQKVEDDSYEKLEISTDSSKDETLQSLKKNDETQEILKNVENTLFERQHKLEKTPPSDNDTIDQISVCSSSSSNHQNSVKEDKIQLDKGNLSNIEKSLSDLCESTKNLENMPENLLDTSTEVQKNNEEIEILNINSDVSIEKSMQPNVTSSCAKSLTSSFMNKSSSLFIMESETKSMKKELSKRRRSRESTEIVIKHGDLSKEATDNPQEKMDISIESLNSVVTNETVLSQHDSTKLVDKVTNKDETSIENISTSSNENVTGVTSESDKINKKECTVIDNKISNKIESDKVDKTSCPSISPAKSTQIENTDDNKENLSLTIDDDNEIKLTLEERSLYQDENEVLSNVTHSEQSIDLQISSPTNESSDYVEKKQENLPKLVMEPTKSSSPILETNNFAHDDSNDTLILEDQSSDIIEISKKSAMDISPDKTAAKDILPKKITRSQNLKRKSTDVDESLQMETSQKDQEDIKIDDASDVNGIDFFQDIPIDKGKEKNDGKIDLMQSISQSMEEIENDNEAERDIILVNKEAWLAAENIKATKEAESFEYDSNDTVLLKSQLDAMQTSYNTKKLDTVDEELLMDIDSEENEKRVKKRKSKTKKRLSSEIDQDSSRYIEDEDNLATIDKSFNDESFNESKTALNPTNDQSMSRLNKSEQFSAKPREQFSKASDESDKEIEDNASKLNRSSLINKKDTFLRKSIERRGSLNKSSKDSSVQNVSANKSPRIDDSEEELDNTDAHIRKKLYKKKRSLNKSRNEDADNNTIESEIKNVLTEDSEKDENASLNRSVNQESKSIDKIMIYLNNDDESDSNISIAPMNFESKTSMIVNAGSDSSDQDEHDIPSYLFAKSNSDDTDSSSNDTDGSGNDSDINSDINREYNLDGVKLKFSDDDVPADECRTSEVEFSDSDDNGSDLADFIVDDDDDVEDEEEDDNDVENEEENDDDIYSMKENDESENEQNVEENDDDIYSMKENDESENEQNVEENNEAACEEEVEDEEDEDKQAHINTESINIEDENEKDNEDIQEKNYITDREEDVKENKFEIETISSYAGISSKLSHKNKNKSNIFHTSPEYISPRRSDTEMKRDIKMKKSNMKENETTLLDSSNSDLSIKKKKSILVPDNLTSSLIKQRKSDSQNFSKDGVRHSSEQLMKFSTPNHNSYQKLEFDESISENKDTRSDNTIKATQNILIKKEKLKKDSISNKDVNLKKFSYANKEKMLNSDFSPDLLKLLERTSFSKSTSSKTELHKTIDIVDTETPTIKHLRKEKLNESVPTLKLNAETSLLSTKKLSTGKKDTAQIKIKEKNNKDEVLDLEILSNDDSIQKRNQKKQKKYKKRDTSKKNIFDEILSEDAIELNVSEKKKPGKLTQLTVVDDIQEDACQINEKRKKKKKNKKQDTSKENITDKTLSEDAVELKIPKKKKLKATQLTIINVNTHEDVCQINKKKKKKRDTSRENIIDKTLSEDAVELKIPKKKKPVKFTQLTIVDDNIHKEASINEKKEKKKKKTKQETLKENIIDEALYEDVVELKIPKKKKCTKFIQSSIVEDNTCEDMCQINEKEKQKKKQKTLKENITEKTLFEDVAELKISKKKKRTQLSQLAIVDDNTYKSTCHINEKKKKKKKENPLKDVTEKVLSENEVELKISKKKKCSNFNQLASIQDNTREDSYQINEKEKKKKKKQMNVVEEENVNEDNVLRKNIRENKTELAQQKKKNKIVHSLKLDSSTDEPIIKKKKQQETMENIERTKKNTLPVQIPVLKLKSNKDLSRKLLRKTALDEVTANIPKELKPKKKRGQTEDIENVNIPIKKSKKEVKEMTKFLPSSSSVKRLSDNVIENLTDVPKMKKRQKVSRNEEQIVSSVKEKKSKVTTADCDNLFTLNTSDCTTQFHIVNLQNAKKQPSKGAAAAASFRQRMLAKNNREPISAYMVYQEKMNVKY